MHRFISQVFIISAALWITVSLSGCGQSVSLGEAKPPFGPVYSVESVNDPIVAKALKGVKKTDPAVAGAEIRGFLVDWVIRKGDESQIREFAVMKGGSLYWADFGGTGRPSAAFGNTAPARLTPESITEAKARKTALATASRAVAKLDPTFTSVKPVVYSYLVRIHHVDNTFIDVWVSPRGERSSGSFKLLKVGN
jgi:hypothetical protein